MSVMLVYVTVREVQEMAVVRMVHKLQQLHQLHQLLAACSERGSEALESAMNIVTSMDTLDER